MSRTGIKNIYFSFLLAGMPSLYLFAQTVTITGKVRHEDNVMPAATISVAGINNFTDKNGEFHFTILPGRHLITITYTGFQKIEYPIRVTAGQNMDLNFEMI